MVELIRELNNLLEKYKDLCVLYNPYIDEPHNENVKEVLDMVIGAISNVCIAINAEGVKCYTTQQN